MCTPYNSWFLVLEEHPIHIPPLRSSSFVHSSKSQCRSSGSHSAHKDFPEWPPFNSGLGWAGGTLVNPHFSFHLLYLHIQSLTPHFSMWRQHWLKKGNRFLFVLVFFFFFLHCRHSFQSERAGCSRAVGQNTFRKVPLICTIASKVIAAKYEVKGTVIFFLSQFWYIYIFFFYHKFMV